MFFSKSKERQTQAQRQEILEEKKKKKIDTGTTFKRTTTLTCSLLSAFATVKPHGNSSSILEELDNFVSAGIAGENSVDLINRRHHATLQTNTNQVLFKLRDCELKKKRFLKIIIPPYLRGAESFHRPRHFKNGLFISCTRLRPRA